MAEADRRANFILKNAEQYQNDRLFRHMVDSTVYLSDTEKLDSVAYVINRFGFSHGKSEF